MHIQVSIQECSSVTEHSLPVPRLGARKVSVVDLSCVSTQSLESFSLLHLEVIEKDAECSAHFATLRIIESAVLVCVHGKTYELSPKCDLLGILIDQTKCFSLQLGWLIGCPILQSCLLVRH